jgi:diguanylate cyclase (GGDEF)-like protein
LRLFRVPVRTIRRDMGENGSRTEAALRAELAKVERSREQIAKAWLVDVILNSELSDVERMPLTWAASELPALISDVLAALSTDDRGAAAAALERSARLAKMRGAATPPAQLTREISYLHSALLATMRMEIASTEPALFAEGAERLAALFTRISGHTVDALTREARTTDADSGGLLGGGQMAYRLEQMVAATKRYGSPFALLVLDIDGPGARNGADALGVVSHAVRGSIRLMDEAFYSDSAGLCVLAPNQTAASAAQMAHRISEILSRLERASGLRITVSAGVVGCPEHGEEPTSLLRAADSAMWRARATGQPFTVASLQDR